MTTETLSHEVAVDTAIAAAWDAFFDRKRSADIAADAVHYDAKDRKVSKRGWGMTLDAAGAACNNRTRQPWEKPASHYLDALTAAKDALTDARQHCEELEAQYTGWSRFFIVPGGHIHSSRSCSTCYVSTMFGWLPQLSGLTEADAVAAHGPLLCSVCFPSAPVEWTVGPQTKKTYCPGTGKPPKARGDGRHYTRNGPCSVCGSFYNLTQGGVVRAHKPA